jgi:DnaJ-class molecular chaperone
MKSNDSNKHECETCNGSGVAILSCCTGEVVDSDYAMCPSCHEHLGEEECPDCNGSGVSDNTDVTPRAEDLMLKAEIYHEL